MLTTFFKIKGNYILLTKCNCIFVVVLRIKSGLFVKQHELVYRYNGGK
jgi:hypothetical protein